MNVETIQLIEPKQAIAAAFSKAAKSYDKCAAFQRKVADHLLNQLPSDLTGYHVLDVGCGTGYCSELLRARGAKVTAFDLSASMLQEAERRCGQQGMEYVQGDVETLSFPPQQFDVVYSSLALQWCNDLAVPLEQIKRVTKRHGVICFSTLVDGSLQELKNSWNKVDSNQHVNTFTSQDAIKVALAQTGLVHHQLDFDAIQMWYPSAISLMKDLKGIGANHLSAQRNQGLHGRSKLLAVENAYLNYQNQQGLLPATYQVCFGVIIND
jgi:malonyl-CoA O-methyltransferase